MGWENWSYWLKGVIIGLIIGGVIGLFFVVRLLFSRPSTEFLYQGCKFCIRNFSYNISKMGVTEFLVTFFVPSLAFAILGFAIGTFLGWICGKIKQRK